MSDDTESDHAFLIARYNADRAHELELDKASGQYELAFFQAGAILNGASATVFLSFLGSTLTKFELRSGFLIASFLLWIAGLAVALWGGNLSYEAQKEFVSARRNRRHATGARAMGHARYARLLGVHIEETFEVLFKRAEETQKRAQKRLNTAQRFGLASMFIFGFGALSALVTVIVSLPNAQSPKTGFAPMPTDWYTTLHDFAAPVATIVAATVAATITFYFNRAQTRIARQQAATAHLQARLATVRLKHDLYDRRFALFSAARSMLGYIFRNGNVSDEVLGSYARDIGVAPFLVSEEVVVYLDHLYTQGAKLSSLNRRLNDRELAVGDERARAAQDEADLFMWFKDQHQELISKFKPFLALDESELTLALDGHD